MPLLIQLVFLLKLFLVTTFTVLIPFTPKISFLFLFYYLHFLYNLLLFFDLEVKMAVDDPTLLPILSTMANEIDLSSTFDWITKYPTT